MNGTKTPAPPTAPKRELSCWYGEIKAREDVLAMLRHCLNLPVSTTETEVLAALDAAVALAATDGSVGDAIEDVREAMRLPVVNADGAAPDLAAEVRKALSALPGASTTNTEMSRGAPAATQERNTMKFTELAAALKVPQAESMSEEGAEKAVRTLAQDGLTVRTTLGLTADAPVAPRLAELVTASAELPKAQAELATARADLKAREDAERKAAADRAEQELARRVDDVCLAKGYGDDVKPALLAFGRADRVAFDAKYPAPSAQELAQRAQDGQRFARLPGSNGAPPPAPDASVATTVQKEVEALQAFATEHGETLTTLEAFALVNAGETLQSYAARLGVRAA